MMTFKDFKTGQEFAVDAKDIKLQKRNSGYYAITKAPSGNEVIRKITYKEYLATEKEQTQ